MAGTDPQVIVNGEVRGVSAKTYNQRNDATGEVTVVDRGKRLTILTDGGGFIEVTVPKSRTEEFEEFEADTRVSLAVAVFSWTMKGDDGKVRTGTSFVLEETLSMAPLGAVKAS